MRLFIVCSLLAACEDMGGRIEVHTVRGVGTRFSFYIPRKDTFRHASFRPSLSPPSVAA